MIGLALSLGPGGWFLYYVWRSSMRPLQDQQRPRDDWKNVASRTRIGDSPSTGNSDLPSTGNSDPAEEDEATDEGNEADAHAERRRTI